VALPALLVLVLGSLALPTAVLARSRCADAAREAARAVARGDGDAAAVAAARSALPGASVRVSEEATLVRIEVRAPVPLPLLGDLSVSASAVTAREDVPVGVPLAGSG
jgi:hypothetical protein